jgi:hypothetical protein
MFIIVLNQFKKKSKKIGAARVRTWAAGFGSNQPGTEPMRYDSGYVNPPNVFLLTKP